MICSYVQVLNYLFSWGGATLGVTWVPTSNGVCEHHEGPTLSSPTVFIKGYIPGHPRGTQMWGQYSIMPSSKLHHYLASLSFGCIFLDLLKSSSNKGYCFLNNNHRILYYCTVQLGKIVYVKLWYILDKYEACLLFLQPKELFIEFDPEPLGTASLAQVHRARLKDGREVAVKVQHPTVKSHSKIDMKGMEVTHDLLHYITVLAPYCIFT